MPRAWPPIRRFKSRSRRWDSALANAWLFHAALGRRMRDWDLVAPPAAVQASAYLSLALWTVILVAGKLTPFVSPD